MPRISDSEAISIGLAHQRQGQPEKAEKVFRGILKRNPDNIDALDLLGWLKYESGSHREALDLLKKANDLDTRLGPKLKTARNTLIGQSLTSLCRYDEAAIAFKKALEFDPESAVTLTNLGTAYLKAGDARSAAKYLFRALEVDESMMPAINNLGVALRLLNRTGAAAKLFRRATRLHPEKADLWFNLGNAFKDLGRLSNAVNAYKEALTRPACPAWVKVFLRLCLASLCRWDDLAQFDAEMETARQQARVNEQAPKEPPALFAMRCMDPLENLAIARAWSEGIEKTETASVSNVQAFVDKWRDPGRRPVIGYVFNDFKNHQIKNFVLSLAAHHRRFQFEIKAFAGGTADGSFLRRKIEAAFESFFDISHLSAADAARVIESHGVDILIDLSGHSSGNRLDVFAHRPAPIQASHFGFPGTTGAAFIDYLFTDRVVTPGPVEDHISEVPVYLPGTFKPQVYPRGEIPVPGTRADMGLPDDGTVICCFSKTLLIDPSLFDVWMDCLHAIPGSVLWLSRCNPETQANLQERAGQRGIDPGRVVFARRTAKKEQHLGRLRHADFAVDTNLWRDHTAVSDALWAGVPVVSVAGTHFASRTSASVLSAVGLQELVASDFGEYKDLVVRLATDVAWRKEIAGRLNEQRISSGAFDVRLHVRHLETAYREMWETLQSGEAPQAIDVPRLLERQQRATTRLDSD